MPLVPKISVVNVDAVYAKSVTLQDVTGAYNSGTNPGGYGSPNYGTSDLDWAVVMFRNYNDKDYKVQKLTPLTGILSSGQAFAGLPQGQFGDGMWEVKYYPVVAHPVTPGQDTTVGWVPGTKTFTYPNASSLLVGVTAILIKNDSETKLYYITSLGANSVTVDQLLPAAGIGKLALAWEASSQFWITASGDDCLAKDAGKIVKECSCFDPEMQALFLRMGQRDGAEILYNTGNYQAAHELAILLASHCNNTSKCGC